MFNALQFITTQKGSIKTYKTRFFKHVETHRFKSAVVQRKNENYYGSIINQEKKQKSLLL